MERSPMLVIPNQNESCKAPNVIDASSENGNFVASDYNNGKLEVSSPNNLQKNGSIPCLMNKSRSKGKGIIVRTIHNTEISLSRPISVSSWKSSVCNVFPNLALSDIMMVRGGKLLSNDDLIGNPSMYGKRDTFVLLSTAAKKLERVVFRSLHDGDKSMDIPFNIKVSALKKELYNKKITSLKPEFQRLIVDGKVLKDFSTVGDHLLSAVRSDILRDASTRNMKKGKLVIHITRTIDPSHEVDINVKLNDKHSLKVSFELSKPLELILDIMHKKYMFPLPNRSFSYVFYLPQPNPKQKHPMLELDMKKCLLDYGITNNTKTMTLEIARMDLSHSAVPSSVFMPINVDQIVQMLMCCVLTAAKLVENENPTEALRLMGSGKRAMESSTIPSLSSIVPSPQLYHKLPTKSGPTKRSKCENEVPMAELPLFTGLKKGFLQSDIVSDVENVVQKSATTTVTSKIQSSERKGLFQGMKKGFLGAKNSNQKK